MPGPNLHYFEAAYATYDSVTGLGTATTVLPAVDSTLDWACGILGINRSTQNVFGVDGQGRLLQVTGTTVAANSTLGTSNVQDICSNDTGAIFVALTTGPATSLGAFEVYTSFSSTPTFSNPWPGASGSCKAVDTLGTIVYGLDGTSGLYMMSGLGPTISLVDGSVTGPYQSAGKLILGDSVNNGIWILDQHDIRFWNQTGPTTTTIPLGSTNQVLGMCLDETASNLIVLYLNNVTLHYHVVVINASTLTVVQNWDTGILESSEVLASNIAEYNGYAWLSTAGSFIYAETHHTNNMHQVNLSTGSTVTFGRLSDYSSIALSVQSPIVAASGKILVSGYKYNWLANGTGTYSGGVLTDPSANFIGSGVQPYSTAATHLSFFVVGNPPGDVTAVSTTTLTATLSGSGSELYNVFTPFENFDFSCPEVALHPGEFVTFNIPTTYTDLADTITAFTILSGAFIGASLTINTSLPNPAGTTFNVTLNSLNPTAAIGTYTIVLQGSGTTSGNVTETLTAVLYPYAEINYSAAQFLEGGDPANIIHLAERVYNPIQFLEAFDPINVVYPAEIRYNPTQFHDAKNLALITKNAEIVLNWGLISGGSLRYLLRASCSAAMGGYIFWENTTGDNTNRPTCSGSLGPTFLVDFWVEGQ